MTKVHVIGHRRSLRSTLETLYELGTLHLVDVSRDSAAPLPPLALDDAQLRELEELRRLRARLGSVLELAPLDARPEPAELDLGRLRSELDEAAPEIDRLVSRLDRLREERESLPRHLEALGRLTPLVPELIDLSGYDTAALLVDARRADVLADLNAHLDESLAGNFEIVSDRVGPDTIGAILVFPKSALRDVETLLGSRQVGRIRLPERYERVPFEQAIQEMRRRLGELPAEIAATEEQIAAVVRRHPHWPGTLEALDARLSQLGAIGHLGTTRHAFLISGWVPRGELARLQATLHARVGDAVMVDEAPVGAEEGPPVLLANPAPVRPFQSLVSLLSLPRAGTLDPTPLMAVFLPLFFGIMLGDIVYGGVLLAVASAIRPRLRPGVLRDVVAVLRLAAGWAVLWGLVFGEFLGDLGHEWFGLEPWWIDRGSVLTPLLLFSIALGAGHVVLGLVLGIVGAARAGNRRLLTERGSTLVALAGLLAVAGAVAGRLPAEFVTPGVAALVVGVSLLAVAQGPLGILLGPLHFIGTLGNVLSYLRIAAIGLASVYLARVANELGATGPLWLGVLVAVLFHALNLALGTFSPMIQALRLHYVEFFGKFFEEGGEPYRPFGPARPRRGRPAVSSS